MGGFSDTVSGLLEIHKHLESKNPGPGKYSIEYLENIFLGKFRILIQSFV